MGKHAYFPSTEPLAFMRLKAISADRIDGVAERLRLSGTDLSLDALQIINDLAAHWVSATNELGQIHEEKHAA